MVALRDLPRENLLGHRVLDISLHRPSQRPRTVDRVEPLLGQPLFGFGRQRESDLVVLETGLDFPDPQVDYLLDLLTSEGIEDYDLVYPVQELGPE